MGLKSRDPKKTCLGLLLNIHNKFQLPDSIWRGVMRGTNLRKGRNEKTTSLELGGVEMGLKSGDPPPKGTFGAPTQCTYRISTS